MRTEKLGASGSTRLCSIDGCSGVHYGRGWCRSHYARWYRYGDPTAGPRGRRVAGDWRLSFWSKVQVRWGECWEWIGGKSSTGYGKLLVEGTQQSAHRVSYELLVGAIPGGLEIDHLCRNRGCVNPGHLEPVTHSENIRRYWRAA